MGKCMFCVNVGKFERIARIIAGLTLFYFGVIASDTTQWWGLVGLIPILTGVLGWCPAYLPFKINTNK